MVFEVFFSIFGIAIFFGLGARRSMLFDFGPLIFTGMLLIIGFFPISLVLELCLSVASVGPNYTVILSMINFLTPLTAVMLLPFMLLVPFWESIILFGVIAICIDVYVIIRCII
jgi:hypothetical protein